jgi:hypothetical protein
MTNQNFEYIFCYIGTLISIFVFSLIIFWLIILHSSKTNLIERINHMILSGEYSRAYREIARLLFMPSYPRHDTEVNHALGCLAFNRMLLNELENLVNQTECISLLEIKNKLEFILNDFENILKNQDLLISDYSQKWNELALELYKIKFLLRDRQGM